MINFYQQQAQKGIPDFEDAALQRLQNVADYWMPPALERAVNMALYLGQPLLLTGPPGTGKTALAYHLQQHFSASEAEIPLFRFNTKTNSVASDLFYRYDSLRHFQFAQNRQEDLSITEIERLFIRYQALGEAIRSNARAIVLIDEIDKAPRDLPNDILDVLEHLSFEVPELGYVDKKRIATKAAFRPLVILTSNSEKNLPDAFLRRCVYFHIEFPNSDQLAEIMRRKTSNLKEGEIAQIIQHFQAVRKQCQRKKPATAELLQWMLVLEQLHESEALSIDQLNQLEGEQKTILQDSYSVLVKDEEDLKNVKASL